MVKKKKLLFAEKEKRRGLDFDTALSLFRDRCIAKNLSNRTLEWYDQQFNQFRRWLNETCRLFDVQEMDITLLRKYVVYLSKEKVDKRYKKKRTGMSPATVNGHIRALKALFNFLYSEKHIAENPAKRIERQKEPKFKVKPLTKKNLNVLLRLPNRKTFIGERDYLLMKTLLDSGMRISEAVNLRVEDLKDTGSGASAYVVGKGVKERMVYLSKTTWKQMKSYLDHYFDDLPPTIPVFPSEYGHKLQPLTASRTLRDYGKMVDIKSNPHRFRHTFAINYLLAGGDIRSLQVLMGHSSPDTCFKYLGCIDDQVREAHRKFSPVEYLGVE